MNVLKGAEGPMMLHMYQAEDTVVTNKGPLLSSEASPVMKESDVSKELS